MGLDLRRLGAGAIGGLLIASFSPHAALAAQSFDELFTEGKASVSFRYRFEFVDQDAFEKNAEASTLRGRLNFKTGEWNGWSAFGEFDYVANIIWDDYNGGSGTTPDKTEYPVVSDPTGEDLNQAYVQWAGAPGAGTWSTLLRGGRQRIIYDNARFIGASGWRQNEQTFDAVTWQQKSAAGFDFQVAYVWQVNRTIGNDVPAGTDDSSTWFGNLAYDWQGIGRLSGYVYDLDDKDVPAFSSQSAGVRFAGSRKVGATASGDTTLGYALEYAHQSDAHDNPVDFGENYYRIDLSVAWGKLKPYAWFESLGGDHTRAGAYFRTPLATLHGFNGWADKFTTTPDAGLTDFTVGLQWTLGAWTWDANYHDYDAESGDQSWGQEIDASLTRSFATRYAVLIKGAWFNGETGGIYDDTTRYWVQFTADF